MSDPVVIGFSPCVTVSLAELKDLQEHLRALEKVHEKLTESYNITFVKVSALMYLVSKFELSKYSPAELTAWTVKVKQAQSEDEVVSVTRAFFAEAEKSLG